MSYRVIVKIEVVNEEGDPVNYKGYVGVVGRKHSPLETSQEFSEHEAIADAHQQLNNVFHLIEAAQKLK
jgi:hypothetical protein